jgi:hypothetical protein
MRPFGDAAGEQWCSFSLVGVAMNAFAFEAKHFLDSSVPVLPPGNSLDTDYRDALCRFEDDLFERYRHGHRILHEPEARALISEIFAACERPAPSLELVPGFTDPRIGGYADVAGHRILIETGCLYIYLVLHEIAHILVPEDRWHGPAFAHVLQALYRTYLDIPEDVIRLLFDRHGLPAHTVFPN